MERKKILKAMGAELLLTPAHQGTDGAIEEVYRLIRENPAKYFLADQFNNPDNPAAHQSTAREIWEQTGGQITMLVATLGTSGTVMGLYRFLKEFNPAIRVVAVEPFLGHAIQGLKNMKESYKPGIFDKGQTDEIVNIEDEEAYETARKLARQEGLFLGMSSGAAVAVAVRQAREMTDGLIVVIAPDGGERYLSTSLFVEKEVPSLCFYNTLARAKEAFQPRRAGRGGHLRRWPGPLYQPLPGRSPAPGGGRPPEPLPHHPGPQGAPGGQPHRSGRPRHRRRRGRRPGFARIHRYATSASSLRTCGPCASRKACFIPWPRTTSTTWWLSPASSWSGALPTKNCVPSISTSPVSRTMAASPGWTSAKSGWARPWTWMNTPRTTPGTSPCSKGPSSRN